MGSRGVVAYAAAMKPCQAATLTAIAFVLAVCGNPTEKGKESAMPFDNVSAQLVSLTKTEEDALTAGTTPGRAPGQKEAVEIATSWIDQIMVDSAQPPGDARYIAFAGDRQNRCDIVRVRYQWAGKQIDIGQTFCLISITLDWPKPPDQPTLEFVKKVAAAVLTESLRFEPQQTETHDGLTLGIQTQPPTAPDHSDHIDHLHWWCDGRQIGFVTLKVQASPGRAVMSWAKELNLSWFDLYAR